MVDLYKDTFVVSFHGTMPRTWQRVATNPPGQMQLRHYPPPS